MVFPAAKLRFNFRKITEKGKNLRAENAGERAKKSGKPRIAPLQPPTLATFRSWGSSAGAGRSDLPLQRYVNF